MADFNPACAEWVYDLVSKMDDGEAESFALVLAHDLWSRDMAGNERFLRGHVAKADRVLTEDVAKALLEHLNDGGDPDQAVAVAASVAIAKDDHDWWRFQERNHGRFGRMTGAQYRAQLAQAKAKGKAAQADVRAQRKGYLSGAGLYGDVAGGGHALAQGAREYEDRFNRRPSAESGSTDTFNRLATGGRLVQQIGASTGSQKTAIAGAVANYAGQFGPEAEKVVGPSVRRAAYRYRGTERTPDKELVSLTEMNARAVLAETGRNAGSTKQVVTTAEGKRRTVNVPNRTAAQGLSPQEKVHASESAAIQYFVGGYRTGDTRAPSRLPSARLSELQRSSGRITPSEGVIIDASGKVAHQAVGYGEDHYLPFNLKNLAALKGGSYVRTRESGGLTTEDIYTGLVSGARSMTVVSNSGVFTVDFADDLRGGRRYNDKARQMVSRYGKTLDAVKSQQVKNPNRQLPPEERARIRIEAEDKVNNDPLLAGYSAEERETWIKSAVNEELSRPRLTREQLDSIERKATEGTDDPKEQRVIRRELTDEAMEKLNTRNYQLDGEGYSVALDAVREQFPYFIADVRYQTKVGAKGNLRSDMSRIFNSSTDGGYVKPRFNRPEGAREGYYDESITGSGKRGADQTGYQNWAARRKEAGPRSDAAPVGEERGSAKPAETPDAAKERIAAESKTKATQSRYADAVGRDAAAWLKIDKDDDGGGIGIYDYPQLESFSRLAPDERASFLADPRNSAKLEADLDKVDREVGRHLQNGARLPRNRHAVKEQADKPEANKVIEGLTSPVTPPAIEARTKQAMMADQNFLHLMQMSDGELQTRSNTLREARAKESDPEKVSAHNRAISIHEHARAAKASTPVELEAEDFNDKLTEAAAKGGTLNELPKVVDPQKALNDHLVKLRDQHARGAFTDVEYHRGVRETLNGEMGAHLDEQARRRLHQMLVG